MSDYELLYNATDPDREPGWYWRIGRSSSSVLRQLALRTQQKKIYSLSGLPSTAAGIFCVCLLHAHILPARMSVCCWNMTTSTPMLRSPCRRSRCASLVGHN